jgi:hypothetical protein
MRTFNVDGVALCYGTHTIMHNTNIVEEPLGTPLKITVGDRDYGSSHVGVWYSTGAFVAHPDCTIMSMSYLDSETADFLKEDDS